MNNEFAFLSKMNFWVMVFGAANVTLIDPSFATQPWYVSLGKFLGLVSAGFVTVQQVHRMSDKEVEVAQIRATAAMETANIAARAQMDATNPNIPPMVADA